MYSTTLPRPTSRDETGNYLEYGRQLVRAEKRTKITRLLMLPGYKPKSRVPRVGRYCTRFRIKGNKPPAVNSQYSVAVNPAATTDCFPFSLPCRETTVLSIIISSDETTCVRGQKSRFPIF